MVRNYCSKIISVIRIKLIQQHYGRLKYIFKEYSGSNALVVSFAGFPGKGTAKYNYMKTLADVKCNQLFLLDDFGYKKRGSYYLGGGGFLKEDIISLITKIASVHTIDHMIMIGSSKGGTCALYYGLLCNADECIIGAPQYHIGDYLSTDEHLPILQSIMRTDNEIAKDRINSLLPKAITGFSGEITVYLHYSPSEHTYKEHIKDMIRDLHNKHGITIVEDKGYDYTLHSDVAKFFPTFLRNTINNLINADNNLVK